MKSWQIFARFRWWHEVAIAVMLVGLLVVAGWLMPTFLKVESQLTLSRQLWELAIVTLGMTLIVITGGIDLSVGATMGLCAVVFGMCFTATKSLALAGLACLITGLVCGALNGVLISKFKVHPLIITLATFAAFRGIAEGISQGAAYSQFGAGFGQLARGSLFGVPYAGYLFAALALGIGVFLAKTSHGRFIYAIGHNETAARFAGVAVDRIKFCLYALSGSLAGLSTVIYVSRFDTARADAGKGLELDAITAVVVGGTSIFGGRGNIVGSVLGLLLIHETRLFVSRYWRIDELRSIVIGILLIVSVLLYRVLVRKGRD
ncbi:MAG: ABC transporter permease [Pirellulaceae bacterium]|nr:ABC transporter permease [Pirellulaceae bacterium]